MAVAGISHHRSKQRATLLKIRWSPDVRPQVACDLPTGTQTWQGNPHQVQCVVFNVKILYTWEFSNTMFNHQRVPCKIDRNSELVIEVAMARYDCPQKSQLLQIILKISQHDLGSTWVAIFVRHTHVALSKVVYCQFFGGWIDIVFKPGQSCGWLWLVWFQICFFGSRLRVFLMEKSIQPFDLVYPFLLANAHFLMCSIRFQISTLLSSWELYPLQCTLYCLITTISTSLLVPSLLFSLVV